MSNMSYCRFHNTSIDLEDCKEELIMNECLTEDEDLSRTEFQKAKDLIEMCREIAEHFEDVDLYDLNFKGDEE